MDLDRLTNNKKEVVWSECKQFQISKLMHRVAMML